MAIPDTPSDGRFRVLVVEDDLSIARLVTMNLKKAGLDARHASDGASGFVMFQEIDPHLVITDIMMPGLNGHELCAKIRETSSIPIIMMTAADSEERQMQGFKVGADDYVPKPFNPRLMVARVVANLRRVYRYDVNDQARAESGVPKDWLTCDSCGYMGPRDKFERLNKLGQKAMVCPLCAQSNITFPVN